MLKTFAFILCLLFVAEISLAHDEADSTAKKPAHRAGFQKSETHENHGPSFGRGRGPAGDARFAEDHETIHFLLSHRTEITRKVTLLKDGVETVTESKNPEVAAKIREHVAAMYDRVEETRPIHMRDPLFREIFRHADLIEMKTENTHHGIRVIETSKNAHMVRLIKEHAQVVSLFLKNGHAEVRKNHAVPAAD